MCSIHTRYYCEQYYEVLCSVHSVYYFGHYSEVNCAQYTLCTTVGNTLKYIVFITHYVLLLTILQGTQSSRYTVFSTHCVIL